jgi:hypothetical protein
MSSDSGSEYSDRMQESDETSGEIASDSSDGMRLVRKRKRGPKARESSQRQVRTYNLYCAGADITIMAESDDTTERRWTEL